MGGLIQFPRANGRRDGSERRDGLENATRSTRTQADASLITWTEVMSRHDDDDGDGGGSAA